MLLLLFFRMFITELPCHAVTLKSTIRISYSVIKYKTDVDIKEVVRLAVFTLFAFTLYINLSPPSLEVVANSISSF